MNGGETGYAQLAWEVSWTPLAYLVLVLDRTTAVTDGKNAMLAVDRDRGE